mmetsp:Transcript_8083/g.33219  ORF Transcript_8083/g.33219 Transcript_8083/m.33219 type:complete len:252 (-) Transcript_8083:90-845(-)
MLTYPPSTSPSPFLRMSSIRLCTASVKIFLRESLPCSALAASSAHSYASAASGCGHREGSSLNARSLALSATVPVDIAGCLSHVACPDASTHTPGKPRRDRKSCDLYNSRTRRTSSSVAASTSFVAAAMESSTVRTESGVSPTGSATIPVAVMAPAWVFADPPMTPPPLALASAIAALIAAAGSFVPVIARAPSPSPSLPRLADAPPPGPLARASSSAALNFFRCPGLPVMPTTSSTVSSFDGLVGRSSIA